MAGVDDTKVDISGCPLKTNKQEIITTTFSFPLHPDLVSRTGRPPDCGF